MLQVVPLNQKKRFKKIGDIYACTPSSSKNFYSSQSGDDFYFTYTSVPKLETFFNYLSLYTINSIWDIQQFY